VPTEHAIGAWLFVLKETVAVALAVNPEPITENELPTQP
jgi:hypothetical protein